MVESALRQDEEHYLGLVERCSEGILVVRHGRVAGASQAAAQILGYDDAGSLGGLPLFEALHTGTQEPLQPGVFERMLVRRDGSAVDAEVTVAPCLESSPSDGFIVTIRDLGARRHVAAALSRQDRYLRLITDNAPALIAYIDDQERYRFANATYEPWYGLPPAKVVGRRVEEVVGRSYEQLRPYIHRALNGEPVKFEATVHNALGRRHLMFNYAPDLGSDGSVRGFSAMVMDITERRNAEQEMREQEKQLRVLTDAVPVLIAKCGSDYRLSFVNSTFANRYDIEPAAAIGRRIAEVMGEETFATVRQYVDAALQGKPQEHEVSLHDGKGAECTLHMMYVPESDDEGRVRSLVIAITDTTRLRDTEEQLQRREREFKTLVENSPDIISRIDRNMRHMYANPAIERLTGFKASAVLGKTKAELGMPRSVVRAWDDAARAAFTTGVEQRLDFDHVIDGQMRYFSGRVIPEIDRYGNIESVVGIAYDVTERARMEKERDDLLSRERSARIQAETAARARDEFLAIVSHELRAPLNGIQSWAHVLENYVKDATSAPLAQRALQGIKTGVGQQVRLIEDLLDVTRMMSGKLRLVKQPLALLPALQAAVESVRAMAAAKRIGIACTYRITSEQIEGDADRVQQIFWNLLSNAVKFTQEGGNVWLNASQADGEICVAVRDDGVGISPDFLPHLFNRFSQEDTSSTRDHSGLGLGLFLVRHLIELHGGRVRAESQGEGKGSTFFVYFPLRARSDKYLTVGPSDVANAAGVPLPSLSGLRILLIDDQEEARESLSVVLTGAGANVFAASSSREAVAWLCECQQNGLPDVLVCDIAMPGEDGYSTLRRLRSWKTADGRAPLQRMPALALTAFAQREDRIRALTAGFQMHVTKPVAPEELIVVIDTMVTRERAMPRV
ncbi:MAG TPA: PAS domain-containing protein [Noviherbaspirillum sp.]|uniref:PAS domain-containing hybrid sensor histidine kinase/response regulator n=1 Tax=Noviherbaspirillum sp. TaxID=1926288 RepID=UPI002D2EA7EE|nr:PAS domain-containing protein [Noviherbaspirillum sp.]HYD94865.1 PAS domain-containing protein [Noviherbaspirillum sp.]